ncbi:MAG: hypothetical protein ACK4UK_04650 [Flavobacterium sp.]
MKKTLLLLTLFGIAIVSAQETDSIRKYPKVDIYLGLGAQFNNGFNLNSNLKNTGMPVIQEVLPEFAIGFNLLGETYLVDVELATAWMDRRNNLARNQMTEFTTRGRGHYNFVNDKRWILSGGLNLAFSRNDLNLSSRNNEIDLSDLNPETQSNHISLRNHMLYAGPSIGIQLKRKEKLIARLNVGYEFALTNGKWKSDFATVRNTVKEQGVNRFMVGVTIF